MPYLNLLLIIIIVFFCNAFAFSECIPDSQFNDFLTKENVFSSDNPSELLDNYAKEKSITSSCAYEMAKKAVPLFALEWVKKSKSLGCFKGSKKCPDEMKKEIFGNIDLLDQWGLWINSQQEAPTNSLCPELIVSKDADALIGAMSPVLSILKKEEKIKLALENQKLNCQESMTVSADNSPNLEYFKKLHKTGKTASLEDFLKLWYPDKEKEFEKDPYFFNCQSTPWSYLDKDIVKGDKIYLADECKPDVLYSWGPKVKLENMQSQMKDKAKWNGIVPNKRLEGDNRSLFMTMSPVATFGYGEFNARIKIKKGTPYIYGNGWEQQAPDVKVRKNVYQDFTANDAAVIESWSYGTPEHYDEMVRDLKRFASKKRAQTYKLITPNKDPEAEPLANLLKQGNVDDHTFNEDVLKQRLLDHIGLIIKGEGKIFYQEGSCRNRDQHFRTKKPTYFNPH